MMVFAGLTKRPIRVVLGAFAVTIGVMVVATNTTAALERRAGRMAWDSHELYIPPEKRRLLTNGTTDGVPWLEEQLQTEPGRMVALHILNSMMTEPLQPFPRRIGRFEFCGNTPRWIRRLSVKNSVRMYRRQQDEAVDLYFATREQRRFKPLPVVDWDDSRDIESKALAAIEGKDLGMLMVLLEWKATTWLPRSFFPVDERQIRFARNGDTYDVRELTKSGKRLLAAEILGGDPVERTWLVYKIEDGFGDGMAGIERPGFSPWHGDQDAVPTAQPFAPPLPAEDE